MVHDFSEAGEDGLWDYGGFYVIPRRLGFYLINNRRLMKTFKLGNETFFINIILETDGGKTGGQTVVDGEGSQEDASTDRKKT